MLRSSPIHLGGGEGLFFNRNVATPVVPDDRAVVSAASQPRASHASCASETRRRPSNTQRVMVSTPSSVR